MGIRDAPGRSIMRLFIDERGRLCGRLSLIDLAVVLALLSFAPMAYYGLRVIGHHELMIRSVQPTVVIAGVDERLTVMGSGFENGSTVRLGVSLPFQRALFVNEARLDFLVPAGIAPGIHSVFVRNHQGRLAMLPDCIEVTRKSVILAVDPRTIVTGEGSAALVITGSYFRDDSTVTLGTIALPGVQCPDPRHLKVLIPRRQFSQGWYDLAITNPRGLVTSLEHAVEIVRPKSPKDVIPVVVTPPITVTSRLVVLCAFPALEHAAAKQISRNAVALDGNGAVAAQILDVVSKPSPVQAPPSPGAARPSKAYVTTAHVMLVGELLRQEQRSVYLYQGRPLDIGTRLALRFRTSDVVGVVLSHPAPFDPTLWNHGRD